MSSALTLEAVQQRLHELVLLDAGETQPLLPNPDQDPMIATLNALQRRLQSAVSVADWRHQVVRQNVHRIVRSGEWIYRPATHELAWSQEAYDLLGASRDLWDQEAQESFGALPMLPMSVERFALLLRPADAETVATQLGAVSNETASIDLSFQLRTQTGETRWLRMRGHLVKEHQMVCGALQDLTAEVQLAEEQKRASAALQREQELSQQVRALTNSAYWTINIDTQQLWWSPEHFDLWEVEPTTPLTMEVIAQRVHPEDQPKVDAWLHQLQAQPTQAAINFRVQRPTRGIRWMTSTGAARQLDDGTTELYGATRDITEQQEALRLLESYQYAIDQSSIVAITNRRGNITYVNDKFTEISGYSREELLGNNHRLLKSELHPPDFYDELWHTISRGEVWRGEVCNRSKNGSIYWVDTTIVPIRDIAGRIQQYLSIRTEITQRKLAAEERTKLLRRFQNAAEATQFGLGILDPILGEFLEMNEIYRQQHFEGFDIDLRKSLERVVHHRAEVEQALSDIIQKGATCRVRYSIQQQTGKLRWIEAVGGRVFEGMRPLIHAYTRDITEEIQSELERARLLRRFQLATEVSPLGFAVFDPFDGEYLETNERYRQLMFESEETPNLHQVTQRLTHGRMELELSFRKSMETGNPAHVRVGVVTRGEFRWVEVWGSFFEEDGRKLTQVYLLEVTQEVEAKQAQERLMRRMQFATETIGFGTALIDVETGAFLEMNDAHRRQHFGASDPEHLHAMLQRVRQGAPDIQTVFEQTYSEQTVHETRLQIEVDGQLRWIQAWGTALEENGAPQMYVITRDITHTVFAEQERERLVQRLTLALRMADMSVDLFDWDTKVQEERTESFFQRNRLPATTGQTLSEITQQLVHPDDLPALLESHATLGDSSARAEFRLKRNDGSWLWVESYAQLIYQDGHTKMLMLWRNITDQKRAQLERARLQQRMQFTSETTGFEIVIFDPQTYQFVETNELFRQFMEARNLRDMSDYFAQVTQKQSDLAVAIQLTLKTNQTQYVRFAFHHEGVDLWRASWARAAVEGERTLVYVLLRDCTAEVEADQEHDLLVSRLQIAMTIGKYGFQQFDLLSRTYDQFDERLRDLYGFTAEDGPITVPMVAARIHPDDALKLRSHLQQAIRTGTNDRAEFRVQQADGSWRWLEGSGQIVTIQGRRKAIGIVRDIHARKTATEQERLQLLEYIQFSIEAGQFVTYQFDPMTKEFLLVDERFCEFFGVHKDRDLSQADVTTRMHPEDAKRWEQATQELLGEGAGKQRLELRLQHPQRGWRWVQTLRALREINGRKLIVGIGRDITREKTLEQERESLVDKLNMSLDVVNLGTFWQPDVEMEQVQVDERCATLFGVEGDHWIEIEDLFEHLHPDDRPRVLRAAEELQQDQFATQDFRLVHPEQGARWLQITCATKRKGAQLGLLGVVRDITKEKLAEQERENLLHELSLSMHAAGLISFQINLETNEMQDPSPEVRALLALPAEGTVTISDMFQSIHPEDQEAARTSCQRILRGEPLTFLYRVLDPDGSLRWVETTGSLQEFESGRIVSGLCRDVSDRKREEEVLEHQARLASIGEASAALAHELKSPLSAMDLKAQMMEMMLEQGQANEDLISSKVADIRKICQHLQARMQHMQNFSRRKSEAKELCSFNELLDNVMLLTGHTLSKHKIRVTQEIPPSLPPIMGNATQLEQVLINLVNNARDAMSDTETKQLTLQARPEQHALLIRIQDTGTGMSPAVQQRLFDAFYTTKNKGTGTGLGLSIVQRIVDEHAGTIALQSEVGVGTTFTLRFPFPQASDLPAT